MSPESESGIKSAVEQSMKVAKHFVQSFEDIDTLEDEKETVKQNLADIRERYNAGKIPRESMEESERKYKEEILSVIKNIQSKLAEVIKALDEMRESANYLVEVYEGEQKRYEED